MSTLTLITALNDSSKPKSKPKYIFLAPSALTAFLNVFALLAILNCGSTLTPFAPNLPQRATRYKGLS